MGEKVVAGITDDMGEETHCREHPDRTNPSGICPSCLQEKLRKLISSSKSSNPFFSKPPPPSPSPLPPSSFPSSRKKTFWSFLSLSHASNRRSIDHCSSNEVQNHSTSYGRNLSRSRSLGCGSRSFSSDFFDRISNGLGDCALRRAESHRERKTKLSAAEVSGDFEELGSSQPARRGPRRRRWGWAFSSPARAFRAAAGGRSAVVAGAEVSSTGIGGL